MLVEKDNNSKPNLEFSVYSETKRTRTVFGEGSQKQTEKRRKVLLMILNGHYTVKIKRQHNRNVQE